MNLQTAKSFEELLTGQAEPSPYDYAVLFKADGWLARQHAKTRFKLLKAIDQKVRAILRRDERVFYATSGTTVTVAEHFFVGWTAHFINRRALVFTTERVLLLAIGSNNRPGKLVSQMPYIAIASVKAPWWSGVCRVKLLNKKTYDFQGVPKADRKFLADFLADIVKGTNAPFQREMGIEHLCPHCYTMIPGYPLACSTCSGGLKSARKAALRSFVFPGLGDWYLGHRGFAVMEMLGSGFLWLVLVIAPLLAPEDPEIGPLDAGYWITCGLILLVAHGIDSMMTHHFARKGHHPEGSVPGLASPPPLLAR